MVHESKHENASERLFSELHSEREPLWLGDRRTLWTKRLEFIRAHTVVSLTGTDPVSLATATRFLDLAREAMVTSSVSKDVTLGFVFSRPGSPAEHFYLEHEEGHPDKIRPQLTRMGAQIHIASVRCNRDHYLGNKVTMFFLEDDWVRLEFYGGIRIRTYLPFRLRVMTTSRMFMCDGLAGVRQCLGSFDIDP